MNTTQTSSGAPTVGVLGRVPEHVQERMQQAFGSLFFRHFLSTLLHINAHKPVTLEHVDALFLRVQAALNAADVYVERTVRKAVVGYKNITTVSATAPERHLWVAHNRRRLAIESLSDDYRHQLMDVIDLIVYCSHGMYCVDDAPVAEPDDEPYGYCDNPQCRKAIYDEGSTECYTCRSTH